MPVINIVMVEPEIPQNTGNVARTCAVDRGPPAPGGGLWDFAIDDKKLKRAGLDYWHLLDITYYENLERSFSPEPREILLFSTKAPHKHTDIQYPDGVTCCLGKRTAGLPENCCTTIRTPPFVSP